MYLSRPLPLRARVTPQVRLEVNRTSVRLGVIPVPTIFPFKVNLLPNRRVRAHLRVHLSRESNRASAQGMVERRTAHDSRPTAVDQRLLLPLRVRQEVNRVFSFDSLSG